jgi:hypothetical protein
MNPKISTTPSIDFPVGEPAEETYQSTIDAYRAGPCPTVAGPDAAEQDRKYAAVEAEILARHCHAPINFNKKDE